MYIVQNLRSKLYGCFNVRNAGTNIMWHSVREFATRIETKEELEKLIEDSGTERDKVRIIKDE